MKSRQDLPNRFASFCYTCLCLAGGIVIALLALASFVVCSHLITAAEHSVYIRNGAWFWGCFLLGILLLILLQKPLLHIKSRTLFLLLCMVFFAAALYLNLRIPDILRDDALHVNEQARLFHKGIYDGLKKGDYLYVYPFQLGMVTWENFLLYFSDSNRLIFITNAIFVLLLNYFQWRIYRNLFSVPETEDSLGEKYAILLGFAFLPLLFFTRFAYGSIPGLMLAEGGVHFMLCYVRRHKAYLAVVSVLFFTLSYIIKLNYLILGVAVSITLLLLFLQEKKKSFLILAVLILVCAQCGMSLVLSAYRKRTGIPFGTGAPKGLLVAMGLMPEEMGGGLRGGWYNCYNNDTFRLADYDEERAAEMGSKQIHAMLRYWRERPVGAVLFFADKVISSWCDPLFESVWIGPLIEEGNVIADPALKSLYSGGHAYHFAERWMNVLNVLIEGGAAIYFLSEAHSQKKRNPMTALPALYLLGCLLYLLAGETKSQYTFSCVFFLIPCTVRGFALLSAKIPFLQRKLQRKQRTRS